MINLFYNYMAIAGIFLFFLSMSSGFNSRETSTASLLSAMLFSIIWPATLIFIIGAAFGVIVESVFGRIVR